MFTDRKQTIRLFPLNRNYVAASAIQNDGAINNYNLYLKVTTPPELNFSFVKTTPLYTDFPAFVLPNGYYFYKVQYYLKYSPEENTPKYNCGIKNITSFDHTSNLINEDLDTSLAATLCENPERHQILGVSKERNEVFLYTLVPSNSTVHGVTGGSHLSDAYELEGGFIGKKQGISIFKTNGATINSIAGFPASNVPAVAIAFNTGEIILKIMSDNKQLNSIIRLQPPSLTTSAKIQLLSSYTGLLIAHDTNKNTLAIWNLKKANCFIGVYPCPEMCHPHLSSDGEYLTARALPEFTKKQRDLAQLLLQNNLFLTRLPPELRLLVLQYFSSNLNTNDEVNHVHCFELNPFKYHLIKFSSPISDFAIGKDGEVCIGHVSSVTNDCRHEFPGTIDKLLRSICEDNKADGKTKKKEEKKDKHFLSKITSIFRNNKKDDPSTDPKKDAPSKGIGI